MATRPMIRIDEAKCTGCGDCVTACAEGAIQIIEGKANLVSEIYCDGLGACLGHCPTGALTIEEVEAAAFDEEAVKEHLASLAPLGGVGALGGLASTSSAPSSPGRMELPAAPQAQAAAGGGCPGSRTRVLAPPSAADESDESGSRPTQLRQWPVQLHLVSPGAPHFEGADVLLAADCAGFALPEFHRDHLKGKSLAIACPKLDQGMEAYLEKLTALIDDARIASLTVLVMEVPCCSGLVGLARAAAAKATRQIPMTFKRIGIAGDVQAEASA